MKKHRLHTRRLKIWSQDYLSYRYLWPNIDTAIRKARQSATRAASIVVDIGCGHKPYRDLFAGATYLGMDYGMEDASPDFVGDAMHIPVKTESVDIVFSTQVIEHVRHPEQMVQECHRLLRSGGSLILTGPFYWPLHEEPFDYYRFTKYGFEQLLADAGFSTWEIMEDGGDWAQLMLSLNLRLPGMLMIPLRCVVNVAGALLDALGSSRKSPSNYTVLATR